jgi:hypothetical protein
MKMDWTYASSLICLALVVFAAGSGQTVLAAGSAGPSDPEELETFLDDYVVEKM